MNLLLPQDVFVTDGFPKHTYVSLDEGRREEELSDALEQQNKIISISGPSKSGKTTLCDQVFGVEKGVNRLHITGDTVEKTEQVWAEAYKQITDDTDKGFYESSFAEVLERIVKSELPLIIDDFHYIPKDVQNLLCRQLKNAASAGLRIVCLTVPHRGDDPVRNNPDLVGRLFSVNFRYWQSTDLEKIAKKGFPLVGFPINDEFIKSLAREALLSPQIMQTLCLEACRMHGMDTPLETIQPSLEHLPNIRARTLRSYIQTSALEALSTGPDPRGTQRVEFETMEGGKLDVYQCLVSVLKMDPPFLQLSFDEIRDRLRIILVDKSELPNVRSALQQYNKLFDKTNPPLEWDDEKKRLTIIDPHFYFYLRNA